MKEKYKLTLNQSDVQKANKLLFLIGFLKIRMIWFTRPKVVRFNDEIFAIKLKLSRRTKNHFNSMYLGALAVGADLAAGMVPFYFAKQLKLNLSLAFKFAHANYQKRADSDVYFVLKNPRSFLEIIQELDESRERKNYNIPIQAYINFEQDNQLLVAEFEMGLSLKIK